MPKGKPTRAKAKRPTPPTSVDSISNGSLVCPQLESIFLNLHHVYDGINVCRLALEHQSDESDMDVARVIRAFILVTFDKQLIHLSRLIVSFGGKTDYHEGTDYADEKDSKEDGHDDEEG